MSDQYNFLTGKTHEIFQYLRKDPDNIERNDAVIALYTHESNTGSDIEISQVEADTCE